MYYVYVLWKPTRILALHTADTATRYYSEKSTPQIISLHAGLDPVTFDDS